MLGDAGAEFFFRNGKWKLEAASERAIARRRHRHRFRVGGLLQRNTMEVPSQLLIGGGGTWTFAWEGKDLFAKPRPGGMAA